MAADNGLYVSAQNDIIEMQKAIIPSNTKVIVQADFHALSPYAGARRYRIKHSEASTINSTIIQDLGDIDSGDPKSLNDFVKWGFARYPADKKMLIVWSHGDSWYKKDDSKWICPDVGSESLMSIANGDLAVAFSGIPKFDILLLDACSMQSIEVATELSKVADYIIASPTEVPVSGFPYTQLLPMVKRDANSLASAIPKLYTDSYEAYGSQNPYYSPIPVTCSTISTSSLKAFNIAFKAFSAKYRNRADELFAYRNMCMELNTMNAEIDTRQFVTKIIEGSSNVDLVAGALQLKSLWDNAIVASSAIGYDDDIGTATLWYPNQAAIFSAWWQHYYKLKFADLGWLSVLNVSYGEDSIPPDNPKVELRGQHFNTLYLKLIASPDPDPLRYYIEIHDTAGTITYQIDSVYKSLQTVFEVYIRGAGYALVKAIDLSGNASEADSVAFSMADRKKDIIVSPNPVVLPGHAQIKFHSSGEGSAELYIYDLRGRLIHYEGNLNLVNGENRYQLASRDSSKAFASGIYIVKIKLGSQTLQSKFTVY